MALSDVVQLVGAWSGTPEDDCLDFWFRHIPNYGSNPQSGHVQETTDVSLSTTTTTTNSCRY